MANTNGPTKARIFDEALSLVEERGLAYLSMRNLADRLHIKAPSLYKHVDNKDEIIAYIQAAGITGFAENLKIARNTRNAKVLAYRKWAIENKHLYEATFRYPLLRELLPKGLEEEVTKYVIEIAGKDHEHARAVWALLHGLVDLELIGRFPKDANLELTWERALKLIG
jgi:AcrR family transcriptional regulator